MKQTSPGLARLRRALAAERREAGEFGLGLSLLAALLAVLAFFRGREELSGRLSVAAAAVLALALLWPPLLWPLYRATRAVGGVVGWVNTRLLLGLVLYLVMAPIGLALRLLGKDPMDRRWEPHRPSYWREREPTPDDPARDEQQF